MNIFSKEEISAIEKARKENKNKRVEARLKELELRAKGAAAKEVSEATGCHLNKIQTDTCKRLFLDKTMRKDYHLQERKLQLHGRR